MTFARGLLDAFLLLTILLAVLICVVVKVNPTANNTTKGVFILYSLFNMCNTLQR